MEGAQFSWPHHERRPCLLLVAVLGGLAGAALESRPGDVGRAGMQTSSVTTQAQVQGFELTHPTPKSLSSANGWNL